MDDQLDNDLKKRITEVFENFEDSSADDGWLQLREKFPEEQAKRRAFGWVWRGAAAAILLLFLSVGLWMYLANNKPEKISVKTAQQTQSENIATVPPPKHTSPEDLTTAVKPGAKRSAAMPRRVENSSKTIAGYIAAGRTNPLKTSAGNAKNVPAKLATPLISGDTSGKKTLAANTANKVDAGKNAFNQLPPPQLAAAGKSNSLPDTNPALAKPKTTVKPIAAMFAEDEPVKKKTTDEKSKRVRFGIFAATYFNYAKGSNNQANVGAGITSDISITKNLKLVTGITVAQNSLNFAGGVPTATAQSNIAAPGAANAASSPRTASAYSVNSAVTLASVPAFKNYGASLVGLEVPINLKYEIDPQKNNMYIMAGFSSGTFINETYTYQYNYPALLSPALQQTQDETSRKSFNGFYFAKTLNLAVGVGYPLGKNRLILEPFLKYPLDGLGTQNIRFGSGGINLKFNFQFSKK